jgi:hypothetical protein
MGQQRKSGVTGDSASEQEIRNQEVLRANRELAAYFKGRRTEREARAALKIIKAFVRDRERRDAGRRAPLPGATAVRGAKEPKHRKAARSTGERRRSKQSRRPHDEASKGEAASIEPQITSETGTESEPSRASAR